jgi:Relaxase/Mobilisation nuclease domain
LEVSLNACDKNKGEIILSEGVDTSGKKSIINDFDDIRSFNPKLGKAVWHAAFSFAPGDRVSVEDMQAIAEKYVAKFGIEQYIVVRHVNTDHEHFHLVGNRVKFDGSTVKDSLSAKKGIEFAQLMEKEYGLIRTEDRWRCIKIQELNTETRKKLLKKR